MMKKSKNPRIRFKGFTDDWEQCKLGDFCEMFNGDRGINYPKDSDMVQAGIPFVNAGDLQEGKVNLTTANKITREKFDQLGGAKIKRGDILYCLRGTLGKNAFVDNFDEGTVASSLVDIRSKNVDSQYLFTVLNSDIEYRQRILCDEGAAQPNLSARNLANFDIPVPKIEEQVKIGRYFESLSNLITLHQRKLEKLELMKKSLLQKMFPKSGNVNPKIRFKGYTDDWEQRKLGNIAKFINGRAYSQEELLNSGKYKVLRVGNFYTNDSWYYSNLELDDKYYANDGDLLYTWSATFGPHIWHGERVIYHYHIWKVDLSNELDIHFLVHLLEQDKSYILLGHNGSTMVHITKVGMEQKEVIIPQCIEEQKQLGLLFDSLDSLITLHQRKLEKLKLLKKTLLQDMFPSE